MPVANKQSTVRSADLLLVGSDPAPQRMGGSRATRPEHLQAALNAMCTLMLSSDVSLMPKRLAGKVFEKLIRPGRFTSTESEQHSLGDKLFTQALLPLSKQGAPFAALSNALSHLASSLVWTHSQSGPFASKNFENSHAHAVIVGPGGLEERSDVRIGVTVLAPYTRFPDHTQYQGRAFLALSTMEFVTGSENWVKLSLGGVAYSGAGEVTAVRCTTKPLLMLWCNIERR